jgi:site-specific recombinase XerD
VYRRAVQAFTGFLGDRDVLTASRRDMEAYRAHLESVRRSPSTICKAMSARSGFFVFAVEEGVMERNPAAAARRPKLSDASPRRGLTPAEVQALLAVPT